MINRIRIGSRVVKALGCIVSLVSLPAWSATLTTTNYVVTITSQCEEGQVTCDDVTYSGRSKRSGEELELQGETMHLLCGDQQTPCRFLGYRFYNEGYEYQVFDSGVLRVRRGDKLVIDERGQWSD